MKETLKRLRKETGEVLILVLVLLAVGSLILVPLLSYMTTAKKAGAVYENKAADYYAADSGVEDGFWQVKNEHLSTLISSYDIYGFDTLGLHYAYPTALSVDGQSVNVTVDNTWVVKGVSGTDLTPTGMGLSLTDLHAIIEDNRLTAAGSATGPTTFKMTFSYDAEDASMTISQIGVWLPPGFTYTANSCDLWQSDLYKPSSETSVAWAGGTEIIWKFNTPVLFRNLAEFVSGNQPGHWNGASTNKKVENFTYTAQTTGTTPNAVCWLYTGNAVKDLKFAWDADVRVFKIQSVSSGNQNSSLMTSSGTEVDAYGIKVEQRSLAKTISGDYVAAGGTNLVSSSNSLVRDTPVASSDYTVSTVPTDAEVAAAYLYWSGWYSGTAGTPTNVNISPLNPDDGSNLSTNWSATGTGWTCDGSVFIGHYNSGGENARYLTLASSINLGAYTGKTVTFSFQYGEAGTLESSDILQYQTSWNGGTTWNALQTVFADDLANNYPTLYQATYNLTIPTSAPQNLEIRYYLAGFSEAGENCYIDNVSLQVRPFSDDCSALTNWTKSGSTWVVNGGAFRGHTTGASDTLSLSSNLNLSAFAGQTVTVYWQSWVAGGVSSSDRLYVYFSNNGGTSWSAANEIFRGGNGTVGTTAAPYSIVIPSTYLTSSFRMRFGLNSNFTGSGEYCYIDNLYIGDTVFTDNCSNLANWSLTTGAWSSDGNEFVGQYTGADDNARYLTLTNPINLSAYANQIVNIAWQQWATGTLASSDKLQFEFWDGYNWSTLYTAAQSTGQVDASGNGGFQTSQPSNTTYPYASGTQGYFSIQIPNQYLVSGFKIRFYLAGFGSGKDCYIDNIYLTSVPTAPNNGSVVYYDASSYAPPNSLSKWTADINYPDWTSSYNSEFAGTHVTNGNRYLTMSSSLNLSAYEGTTLSVTWNQSETGTLSSTDGLQYQFSGDGGNTWSTLYTAFTDDITAGPFTISIPSQYVTANFKLRFYLMGFGTGKICLVDDIKIYTTGQAADTTCSFKINNTQVYFDSNGNPQTGAQLLTADSSQVINNADYGNPHGYSYSSFKDVTALVRAYSAAGASGNHPGNAKYTVGDVGATSNANDEWAYAGWSLIIIYTSQATLGHQLYLYDTFLYCNHQTDLDFDQDGQPGGTITGFLVPDAVTGETNAAKITAFVGEGDDAYTGDFIAINAPSSYASSPSTIPNSYKLWDGTTSVAVPGSNTQASPNNVWNSKSTGLSAQGIDVDTFNVTWASGLISAGDTYARVDMYTDVDIWNLVYIILSFRSQTTTGGAITYLIKSS